MGTSGYDRTAVAAHRAVSGVGRTGDGRRVHVVRAYMYGVGGRERGRGLRRTI